MSYFESLMTKTMFRKKPKKGFICIFFFGEIKKGFI